MTKHDPNRGVDIMATIDDYRTEHGYAPSVREIGRRVGLASTSAVQYQILRLERLGLVERDPLISRSLRVVRQTPVVGTCARPGCDKPTHKAATGPESRWCSASCRSIANHLRRWLRATGTEYLAEQIGLPT